MTAPEAPVPPAESRPRSAGGPLRRALWQIPLGGQLSLLYTVLLAVTLTLVGVLVYTQQEAFLAEDAATRLTQAATRIVTRPAIGDGFAPGAPGGGGDSRGHGGPSPATDPHQQEEDLVRGLSGPEVTVAILNSQGGVVTATQGLVGDTTPLVDPVTPQQAAAVLTSGQPLHWVVLRADGSRHVVVLMAVTERAAPNAPEGAAPPTTLLLEQSASQAAGDAALARLGLTLLLGVLGGTLAGVVLGLAFTRAVLRPLDRVADTAEAIAGGDLQRRLLLPAGRNEVARLGQAFDFMVGRLVAALEAQQRFVADASHELRTPLTSLKGLAEILMIGAHGNDTRVIEQSAGAINGELERLNRLVNDLLLLSRLDSTEDPAVLLTRRGRMDAAATLQAAVTQMRILAEERDVALTCTCAAPLWIMGDGGQIKQIVLNLLDNAVRHTPVGGTVTVGGAIDGAAVQITVQDTGSGIAAADLPHIFERFYRGDASRTRATGNSGLGLSIVRALVEAHGGQIAVQSAAPGGTCFTIRLPRAPGAPAPDVGRVSEAARR
ncbi:MAG TPA: HAMP domain-containing sensor histidine kinase [Chloroflexia bacterium]|nr:HAMP domain-containing sensor histidine kinase [Chloroflexia bacterium]